MHQGGAFFSLLLPLWVAHAGGGVGGEALRERTIDPASGGCSFELRLRLGARELPPTILMVQHDNNLLEPTSLNTPPAGEVSAKLLRCLRAEH